MLVRVRSHGHFGWGARKCCSKGPRSATYIGREKTTPLSHSTNTVHWQRFFRKVRLTTPQLFIQTPRGCFRREAWAKGRVCARARVSARERAFSVALHSLLSRASEKEKLAAAAERRKAAEKAASSSTVWQAARFGVPVRRLQELMEQETKESRFV